VPGKQPGIPHVFVAEMCANGRDSSPLDAASDWWEHPDLALMGPDPDFDSDFDFEKNRQRKPTSGCTTDPAGRGG